MIPLLLNYLGVKGLAKWAVRLVVLPLLGLLALALVVLLIFNRTADVAALVLAAVAFTLPFLRALVRGRRKDEIEETVGERTIDGKLVPDKIAVAALEMPSESPDGDYVLHRLPDYSKVLLKLNLTDYAYVPEIPPAIEQEIPDAPEVPTVTPTKGRRWLTPHWRMVKGGADGVQAVAVQHPPDSPAIFAVKIIMALVMGLFGLLEILFAFPSVYFVVGILLVVGASFLVSSARKRPVA